MFIAKSHLLMPRENKNIKLEHIKGRYGIIIAFVTGISGALAVPFLCKGDSQPDTATKQKASITTNQNSPVSGEIGTQNNYYTTTVADSSAAKRPGTPEKRIGGQPANSLTTTPPKNDRPGSIYAPNANIVTQNQSGGTNTVIIADSYERKLAALKATPPNASFRLYLKDSILFADVELKNDVPVNFRVAVRPESGPIHYLKLEKDLYPEQQKAYTFKIGRVYGLRPGLAPPVAVFKRIVTVDIESIYYDEMKERALWKKSNKVYACDLTQQTITPTNDTPAYGGSALIYADSSKTPWVRVE